MKFKNWIKKLEKKGIVSKKPHPIIPFILTMMILLIGIKIFYIETNKNFAYALFYFAGFNLIFSILHWIVARTLK